MSDTKKDWPHQTLAIGELRLAMEMGKQRICLTSPTGGGKSRIIQRIVELGKPTLLIANRIMLVNQLARGMSEAGIDFEMMAGGQGRGAMANLQVASIQTLDRRKHDTVRHPAEIVFLDEAHNETGARSQEIIEHYVDSGACVIGVTATPVGVGHMFDHLIIAGKTSDLRKCGSLVPALTYAPDEPAMKAMKKQTKVVVELQDKYKQKMQKVIFARVLEHYHKLNPEQRPSILFAPGVEESRWTCRMFNDNGIPWSHIDSGKIIINGETLPANNDNRKLLAEASQSGDTKGVSNRFVLREGIDWPWLGHGILACSFGSVSSYLQAVGRLLRAYPGIESVTLQDHGGNYWRHGSPNSDRDWFIDSTDARIREERYERYRTSAEPEPIVCPECTKVRPYGPQCPSCGHISHGQVRMIVQTNGKLKQVSGKIFRPRTVDQRPGAHDRWIACYWRCSNSSRTFRQARGLFQYENKGLSPGLDFPMMPKMASDWFLKVKDVPWSRLDNVPDRLSK